MIRGLVRVYRTGGSMLHYITHRNRHWRQGGQLYCAFCMSAYRKPDPMNSLEGNPYLDQYKSKLKEKQREAPQEFTAKLTELEEKKHRKEEEKTIDKEEPKVKPRPSQVRQKQLDKILKLDLLQNKTPEEVGQIWSDFHKTKPVLSAVIPAEEYKEIQRKINQFPMFIYPVPRGDGYEFFLQKFSENEAHFTPLIAYQQRQENAPSCLTLTHYTELMDDKGIVLMVGEPDTNLLGIPDSQLLALQLKLYYGKSSGAKFNFVKQMNNAPDTFQYMDLIKEFESGLFKDINVAKTVA